jgi:spore germination protein KC
MINSITIKGLSIFCLLILLTGCWNSYELTDFAFLMGVSIDQAEDGKVEINAQIYSPVETVGGTGGRDKPSYNNIKTINNSLFDASRDLPRLLGRKAQWGHTRLILIGEDIAKNHNIEKVLDFFYRDHETRFTMYVMITEGKAADFFEKKPFIERTVAQQLRAMTDSSQRYASKTQQAMLLDIAIQMNSKVQTAIIPYVKLKSKETNSPHVEGVVIVSKGQLVEQLSSDQTEKLLMLINDYKQGVIEFPCLDGGDKKELKENLEVYSVTTKMTPNFTKGPPTVHMVTKIKGVIGELQCSKVTSEEEVKKLEEHIEKTLKEKLVALIEQSQEKKVDILDLGNELYKKNPALWKKWEKEWNNRYADIQFVNDVEVTVESTGLSLGEKVLGD